MQPGGAYDSTRGIVLIQSFAESHTEYPNGRGLWNEIIKHLYPLLHIQSMTLIDSTSMTKRVICPMLWGLHPNRHWSSLKYAWFVHQKSLGEYF